MRDLWAQVELKDVRVGDRIGCHVWAHPYEVVDVDADARGPRVTLRRWDGMPYATVTIHGHEEWKRVQQACGRFWRYDPAAPCPHCGRHT